MNLLFVVPVCENIFISYFCTQNYNTTKYVDNSINFTKTQINQRTNHSADIQVHFHKTSRPDHICSEIACTEPLELYYILMASSLSNALIFLI